MKPSLQWSLMKAYCQDHRSQSETLSHLADVALGHIRSRCVSGLASMGEITESMDISEVRFRLQVSAFVKKNETLESDDAPAKALSNFYRGELLCRLTNKRLDHYGIHPERMPLPMRRQLKVMENIISNTLGPVEKFVENIPSLVRLTSGASSSLSRKDSDPWRKLGRKIEITPGALPLAGSLRRYFGYMGPKFVETASNRVTFVLKNWKTRRTIACEPAGNLPFQLAIDAYFKKALLRIGVDLRSQSWNQRLANAGSIDGSYATVDLEMASDTVSLNVVHLLFPKGWVNLLMRTRSPSYLFSGCKTMTPAVYAKYASMGNGTTFSVETLIFAAACKAVGARAFAVYGDDIVIPTDCVDPLLRLLRFLGFHPNKNKTFVTGNFRESCGSNWYRGVDVTPLYFRSSIGTSFHEEPELCRVINGLAARSLVGGETWFLLRKLLKEVKLPIIPYVEDARAGVWITPHGAWSRGLLRSLTQSTSKWSAWVPRFKGYQPVQRKSQSGIDRPKDSVSLFLWFLLALRRTCEVPELLTEHEVRLRMNDLEWVYLPRWQAYSPAVHDGSPQYLYL